MCVGERGRHHSCVCCLFGFFLEDIRTKMFLSHHQKGVHDLIGFLVASRGVQAGTCSIGS